MAVTGERPPAHLDAESRQLRRGLRAKARQLGDTGANVDLLVAECAYEQWHRLLFARFLAENNLLIHPDYHAPVTLEDCDELADSLGEPDGWSVAARFAAEILPGIFRLDDPCVRLRLAPEGRLTLEAIVASLPSEVFAADDALGWVYQFWQRDKKDEVNASDRKIGGADLGPVTQLFTENYMVRFLLENSLGAWWAARHPTSPLLRQWEYLRFDDKRKPAAGSFEGWPEVVAEVTVMDPCCGSGHFLVEAFSMLWQMRAEEEGIEPIVAQDSVLRDNLFGLELDPRCVQIAMFAVALTAWRAGAGWRELPVPNIACSGIPVRASAEEWQTLAKGDSALENALTRLHILFRDADTLGSLTDPKRTVEFSDSTQLQTSFDDVDWDEVVPVLTKALAQETVDPATAVLGIDAAGAARAADYLSRSYTLVATNVPYLKRQSMAPTLLQYVDTRHSGARADLATAFIERLRALIQARGSLAVVSPQNWGLVGSYDVFRRSLLETCRIEFVARLGSGAFRQISGEVVKVTLTVLTIAQAPESHEIAGVLAQKEKRAEAKDAALRSAPLVFVAQADQLRNPDARLTLARIDPSSLLGAIASGLNGTTTGDYPRYGRFFWEIVDLDRWSFQQSTVPSTRSYGGREHVVLWCGGRGPLQEDPGSTIRGKAAWGKRGIAVSQMGSLPVSIYTGEQFDNNTAVILPKNERDLPAIWAYCSSDEYGEDVRDIDDTLKVTNATVVKVAFDRERWEKVAEESGPLPEPWSDDPTQWLFGGRPDVSTEPLQVAVGRLLGYRWPEQVEFDDLDSCADADGIVCLPSVGGEAPAADRLQQLLAAAFGSSWSPAKQRELLEVTGTKKSNLAHWLRDDFFKHHCSVFGNRPFVWHIWDGQRDGFAALVNYHRLDRKTLEKLAYTYLGDWIERQRAEVHDEKAGAEARLAAARALQQKLELILEGEPPYDIYVRWKSLAEQPIGWEPDLNDGVRLSVRPFLEAGVLRSKFNVKWNKDRGKNPDGSERFNDLHYTHAEKRAARGGSA